jgi:phosphoserine phosphatase
MTQTSAQAEQFTGLILLTGTDKPGVAASLFETLAPFVVNIIDIEQVVINSRLILTVLISANPAHQGAIEEDLNLCALANEVDIATLFAKGEIAKLAINSAEIHIAASTLHPRTVSAVAQTLRDSGANIERIVRTSDDPLSLCITISGVGKNVIEPFLTALSLDATITVKAL